MIKLLDNKVVLVTGAGDGIGAVAAETFAREGAEVILLGRTRDKLELVSDRITKQSGKVPLIIPLDLVSLTADYVSEVAQSLRQNIPVLHGLLHNASVLGPKTTIENYDADAWYQVLQINVNSQFLLTQALIPSLRAADHASIVFTSSGVGRRGRAYWGAYAVSKFATEGLMEVLADELATTSSIRVNSFNPGGTRTTMRAAAFPAEDPNTLPEPEDHMPIYLYLLSNQSLGITGRKFDITNWSEKPPASV